MVAGCQTCMISYILEVIPKYWANIYIYIFFFFVQICGVDIIYIYGHYRPLRAPPFSPFHINTVHCECSHVQNTHCNGVDDALHGCCKSLSSTHHKCNRDNLFHVHWILQTQPPQEMLSPQQLQELHQEQRCVNQHALQRSWHSPSFAEAHWWLAPSIRAAWQFQTSGSQMTITCWSICPVSHASAFKLIYVSLFNLITYGHHRIYWYIMKNRWTRDW